MTHSTNNIETLELHRLSIEYIYDILAALKIEYNELAGKIFGPCPIHGGDNPSAFKLYLEGLENSGNWACYTQSCHKTYGSTIPGLIRGILSSQKGYKVTQQFANDYLKSIIGINGQLIIDKTQINKRDFIYRSGLFKNQGKPNLKISKQYIREALEIPSLYFINRGYSKEVLEKYEVGLCKTFGKEMYGRVVVPIYNKNYTHIIGATGRTIDSLCGYCKTYHHKNRKCPETELEKYNCCKWKHSKGFQSNKALYNLWFAKEHITKNRKVFIVEGPADVWRMVEAGFLNTVAIYGKTLHDWQIQLLEKMGVTDIIILLDSDSAGKEGIERIKNNKHLNRFFNIHFPKLSKKDPGESCPSLLLDELKSYI